MSIRPPSTANRIARLANRMAGMGTWWRDLRDEKVHWSAELEGVFGFEAGTFPGTVSAFRELIHPDDQERVERAIADSLRNQDEYCILFRFLHRGGDWRWMEGRGIPSYDEAGKPVRLDGVGIDVTDRTQAENARSRLVAIVESSEDAILSKTLEGIITSWNGGARRLFGYTAEEMIGTSITRLIPADLQFEEAQIIAKLRQGQRIEHYETRRVTKDGALLEVSLTVSPIHDATGAIIGASKIARDVGALRVANAEREQLLRSERAARAEAERLGHLKDEFLATLSHELRTPLSAILGWSNILKRQTKGATPEIVKAVETIERNARAQAQIIDDLLDMSRIVSGKLRLEFDTVEFAEVVRTAVEAIQPAAAVKRIRIALSLEPAPSLVMGDSARLQQVLWNLLTNAIKFTPVGGDIAVSLLRSDGSMQLTVKDSGIGIDPAFLPHVFDRFRQADGSFTRAQGGLGLGLSIVRNLVELHGGSVAVTSDGPQSGATFTLLLPAQPSGATGIFSGLWARSLIEKEQMTPSLAGYTLLAVDDEPDGLSLLSRLLEEVGARVVPATSAEQAIALLAEHEVHGILSDIGMPGTDGYEFMRQVRASTNASIKALPAVALTAYARTEDQTRSLEAGYQLHVSKPYSITDLATRLGELLKTPLSRM